MSDEGRKSRLSELAKIPAFARQDHRNTLDSNGNSRLLNGVSRKERRKLIAASKKIARKYETIMNKIAKTGAGYPVDRILHDLALEYTNRFASSGTETQPINFNYFEAFCDIKLIPGQVAPYAIPITEVDNIFNVNDFFEFITSSESQKFDLTSLMEIPADKAFHYTTNGDINDLSFLNASGRDFLISGFSIVRRDTSLFWYLLGGEMYTPEEWDILCIDGDDENPGETLPFKRAFIEEVVERHSGKMGAPLPLEGTTSALRTIVTGEINLTTKKYYSRCIMTEYENAFEVKCDDPGIFGEGRLNKKRKERNELMAADIEKASVMWDLVASMFRLPSYFATRITVDKDTVSLAGKAVRKPQNKAGTGTKSKYKKIPSLHIHKSGGPAIIKIEPDYYETYTTGHWRRLQMGSTGTGPDGNPVSGRTWVSTPDRPKKIKRTPKSVYIKSTLASAKLKVEEYLNAVEKAGPAPKFDNTGVLYVLRCHMMKDEVYKVGYTSKSAQERAEELSSHTGVPLSFVVVKYWTHDNPSAFETNVHAMLDPYRFNDRREFFKAPYETIEKIIETEYQRDKRE